MHGTGSFESSGVHVHMFVAQHCVWFMLIWQVVTDLVQFLAHDATFEHHPCTGTRGAGPRVKAKPCAAHALVHMPRTLRTRIRSHGGTGTGHCPRVPESGNERMGSRCIEHCLERTQQRALPRMDATERARARACARASTTQPPPPRTDVCTRTRTHTPAEVRHVAPPRGPGEGIGGGGVLTVGLHLDPHQVQHGTASHASLVSNVQTSGPGGGSACGRAGTATATATHTAARRSKRTIFAPPNLKIISDIAGNFSISDSEFSDYG